MIEGLGHRREDFKAQGLPQVHGGVIRRNNGVELNTVKAILARPIDNVLSQRSAHAVALMIGTHHETRGGDVSTTPRTVRAHCR